jgi:hypothetical protein
MIAQLTHDFCRLLLLPACYSLYSFFIVKKKCSTAAAAAKKEIN